MCMEMSEGAYQAMQDDLTPDPAQVWRSKDGREIPIVEMEDRHLINTIRFLRRNVLRYQCAQFSAMGSYVAQAPDGAADCCESEANQLMDLSDDDYLAHRFPSFKTMLAEASRRKLEL